MKTKKRRNIFVYAVLILMAFIMVLPFVWTILTAFKTQSEALKVPPQILPSSWSPRNFTAVMEALPFLTFFKNTFLMVLFRVLGSVFFSAMSLCLCQIRISGKKFTFWTCFTANDGSGTDFYFTSIYDCQQAGLVKYNTGIGSSGYCKYLWNLFTQTVFYESAKGSGGSCGAGWVQCMENFLENYASPYKTRLGICSNLHSIICMERFDVAFDCKHVYRKNDIVIRVSKFNGTVFCGLSSVDGRISYCNCTYDYSVPCFPETICRRNCNFRNKRVKKRGGKLWLL